MLCLSRRVNQEIVIGDVVVKVLRVRGRVVHLGFTAPPSVRISRAELKSPARKEARP